MIFRGKRKGYTRKSLNFLLGGKKDQITQILWLMHFEKKGFEEFLRKNHPKSKQQQQKLKQIFAPLIFSIFIFIIALAHG